MRFADAFTFLSLSAGLFSVALALLGHLDWAGAVLLLSVLLDWLDGRVARHLRQESGFGRVLDSLVDISVFGMVPFFLSLIIYTAEPVVFAAGVLYVGAGAYRLARFHVAKSKDFQGMPITMNGIFFALILLFAPSEQFHVVLPVYFLAASVLMVSTFRVRKP